MIGNVFRATVTCAVCGLARGTRVPLACGCRGWIVFWRRLLERVPADELAARRVSCAVIGLPTDYKFTGSP